MTSLLTVKNISMFFGGLAALNDVSFKVNKGEILGLIGPNGAGKTTLFNVIDGFYKPSRGEVIFRGDKISGLKPGRNNKITGAFRCSLGQGRRFNLNKISFIQPTADCF